MKTAPPIEFVIKINQVGTQIGFAAEINWYKEIPSWQVEGEWASRHSRDNDTVAQKFNLNECSIYRTGGPNTKMEEQYYVVIKDK